MKAYFTIILFLLSVPLSVGQTKTTNTSFLTGSFGRSFSGTGDISGFQYGLEYGQYFKSKKIYWSIGFEGTLHDDETIDFIFEDDNGNSIEGKSRFVVGGIQLVGNLGYQFISLRHHDFSISVGPLFRYQSSSIPDVISTFFPVITDLPFPVQLIEFREPFRTFSLGANIELRYNYKFTNKWFLGFLAGLQVDTNGDTISQASLSIGKFFN